MPELPEVEVVKRGLERRVKGQVISAIEVRYRKSFNADEDLIKESVTGAEVKGVRRYQKMVIIDLSSGWSLIIHLKMTGQLVFAKREILNPKSKTLNNLEIRNSKLEIAAKQSFTGGHPQKIYEQPLPHKHTHVIFTFKNGGLLYFNDLRKFGWIKLLQHQIKDRKSRTPLSLRGTPTLRRGTKQSKFQRSPRFARDDSKNITLSTFLQSFNYSPDPLTKAWTLEDFQENIRKRNITIKQTIMDQRVAAGVGNIYADEALFDAKINPFKKARELSDKEIKKLHQSIRKVLEKGIKYGGTTKNNYRTVSGSSGGMQHHLKVYGREGEKCYRCGGVIGRKKVGGRSTHYCSGCQS